jgi:hypothetical protein
MQPATRSVGVMVRVIDRMAAMPMAGAAMIFATVFASVVFPCAFDTPAMRPATATMMKIAPHTFA